MHPGPDSLHPDAPQGTPGLKDKIGAILVFSAVFLAPILLFEAGRLFTLVS